MSDRTPAWPKARAKDLVTEAIGDETVVYDGLTKEAHCLAPLAAAVFDAADGETSPEQIAAIVSTKLGENVDVEAVENAIHQLEERDLLLVPADGDGVSRRTLLRRSAVVGGAVLVASIATPEMAAASPT